MTADGPLEPAAAASATIVFDASKRETHHPGSGFKKLARRLKGEHKVVVNKDDLSLEKLQEASLVVFGSPRSRFSTEEVGCLFCPCVCARGRLGSPLAHSLPASRALFSSKSSRRILQAGEVC
jgi:hypothetical protein